ncbi:unnamed protein product [Prunus brigantina]
MWWSCTVHLGEVAQSTPPTLGLVRPPILNGWVANLNLVVVVMNVELVVVVVVVVGMAVMKVVVAAMAAWTWWCCWLWR